jgi:alpha-glucosidase
MHSAFNFHYMKGPWQAGALREVIDDTRESLADVGAPATWVLSSHDEVRLATRYGRPTTSSAHFADGQGEVSDLELGTRRARAAAMLMLALPGCAYIYQGEELGLPQVEDLPDEVLQDPAFLRSGGETRGRDGCRVPLPWSGSEPPFGFSPPGVTPWLPQPEEWASLTAEAQAGDPDSTLSMYRDALRLRREVAGFVGEDFSWRSAPEGVVDFERGDGVRCVINLAAEPFDLGEDAHVLLSSSALTPDGKLPTDVAVWLGKA